MTTPQNPLGTCPNCNAEIPRYCLLIEYSKEEGTEEEMFAECPECGAVVHPDPV